MPEFYVGGVQVGLAAIKNIPWPESVTMVLGQSQRDLGRTERSNCINAALNFHDLKFRWKPYSTEEFLTRLQTDFVQLQNSLHCAFGDLVVMWSRTSGTWDNTIIDVHKMNHSDADYPYGLIFDHVAVRVNADLVFHKPDRTYESCYQVEALNSVIAGSMANSGFELTFHRLKRPGLGLTQNPRRKIEKVIS
jgi:hypothetical protein